MGNNCGGMNVHSEKPMLRIRKNIAAALAVLLLAAPPVAYAGDSPSEINQRIGTGDPVAGKDKSAFCQGCHGEDGNSASGTFPKLAGQWSDYIQKQFREFKTGARFNETMSDIVTSVDDFNDLFDITAYFASQKQMMGTPISTENDAEKKLYVEGDKLFNEGNKRTSAFRCVKCHGEHGKGQPLNNNLFPVIGGQHKEYLIKQLTDFKTEDRENDRSGFMLRITTHLTDHDIEALATYLSHEPPAAAPLPPPKPVAVAAPAPPTPPPPAEAWMILLEDKPIRIEGTNFEVGSAKLKSSAADQLKIVVDFAKNRPEAQLKIVGYSDNRGPDIKNIKLSLDRALAVTMYLVKQGVANDRIVTQGLGPVDPIADNKTQAGRSKNRRVEIRSVIKEEKKVKVTQ